MLAAITASQAGMPCARSISICSIRMTALRAIMPNSARMPRMATKPSGRLKRRSANDHADHAHRHHAQDQDQAREALQLDHQEGEHQEQHQRAPRRSPTPATWRSPRPCRRPRCDSRPAGSAFSRRSPASSAATTPSGDPPRDHVGLDGQRRDAVASPDQRLLLLELEGRDLAERHACARSGAGPPGSAASRATRAARRRPARPRRPGRCRPAPA